MVCGNTTGARVGGNATHDADVNLLYAPLAIPLVYCHINNFQRAARLVRPFQGDEKMTAVWASHHEQLCSDGVVAPPVCAHMVVPQR